MRRTVLKRKRARAVAWQLLRTAVHTREGGLCVSCGTFTDLPEGECHHRQLRSRGGRDDAWNCIWLCPPCHGVVHANPTLSTRAGLLCPSWEDPAGWPVYHNGSWFIPSPTGWLKASMRVEQEAS
jgi:hypothetical protein